MPKGDETKKDYEILGLENSASEDDVKRSFMKLALKFHPDLHTRQSVDETSKAKYHEVCQAFKRIVTGERTISEWNCDKSDEIFFSLLREIPHASMKSGSLYSLFSAMPNHETNFQDDNEYRCQEDALDDESEETDFNKLVDILKNRLQNGKSVPAGLTKEKIVKLKEEFAKQKDANKRIVAEKGAAAAKKPNKTVQVPVTKPKPKTKKQLLAEQRRREKEMAKIAAELEEKKKKESEKDNMKKQLEAEKQRKLDEESKKQEEERRREFQEAKKKKDREEREKETRLQKERDRQEKLKKQQEEEQRRKEEEKKRKAEEKAAKAKSIKDAKEKEEKEKVEAAKKAQQAKRQQQYQQYQQQQQKYPREVPPRFLRQQQMKQQQGVLPQPQEQLPDNVVPKQSGGTIYPAKKKETLQFPPSSVIHSTEPKTEPGNSTSTWSETDSRPSEMWGQEMAKESESESSWGGVPVSDDWDTLPSKASESESSSTIGVPGEITSTVRTFEDQRSSEPPPIGSELKQGKVIKKEGPDKFSDVDGSSSSQRLGTFGAIGERFASTSTPGTISGEPRLTVNGSQDSYMDHVGSKHLDKVSRDIERTQNRHADYLKGSLNDSIKFTDAKTEHKHPDTSSAEISGNNTWNKAPCRPRTNLSTTTGQHTKQSSSGPKLTDWSGLDAFEPVPSHLSTNVLTGKAQTNVSLQDKQSSRVNNTTNARDKGIESKPYDMSAEQFPFTGQTLSSQKSHHTKDLSPISVATSELSETRATTENESSKRQASQPGIVGDEEDDYGWTTASRKAKQKNPTPAASSPGKDTNAWVSRSLKQLLDMGFQREDAERALRENNGIIESAVSDLLAGVDLKGNDGKSKPRSLEKEDTTRPSSVDLSALSTAPVPGNGQPRLNRKQRRKLMQQQELLNARSADTTDADQEGEWKLVTRERNSSVHSSGSQNEATVAKNTAKIEPVSRPVSQVISRAEHERSTPSTLTEDHQHRLARAVPSVKSISQSSGLKAGKGGSELSKSLPVLSDVTAPKGSSDVAQLGSDSTSCSASPRSNGSQSPSLNYSHLLQTSVLNNLPFKSLSTDRIPQSVGTHPVMSSASHLFYSDPQLLPNTTSQPPLRNSNHGLLKGPPAIPSSSVVSHNGISGSPFSFMHILNAQPNLVNSVVSKPAENVKPDFPLVGDSLPKAINHVTQNPTQLSGLDHQSSQATTFPSQLPYSTAPQQSKLHQWKQPINAESQDESTANRMSGPSQVTGDQSLNPSGAINAPVTVDPVSAKWGVVAAPRLSPTPSEFRPGVPWKPRSEVEKESKEKAPESDKEGGASKQTATPLIPESSVIERTSVTSEMAPRPEPKSNVSSDTSASLIGETMRPPPGLTDSYAFPNLPSKSSSDKVVRGESMMDNTHSSNNWLVLRNLNEKVEPGAIRSLCQKYGNVVDFQLGPGFICIAFETPKQAMDSCHMFNSNMIFDTNLMGEVVTEEKALAILPPKSWNHIPESTAPTVPPIVTMNQRMPGLWVAPNQLGPDPTCVMGPPPPLGGPLPMNMFEMPSPLTQWSGLPTDPARATGAFWPLQPSPFLPQVPLGTINLPAQPVAGNASVVSPSMTKYLPDGLFNGSESA